ncbi:arginine-tRNA-protein transferase [Xylaria nigripes]|nr:arginine-tRNA-protein transferase [Xylaria nigripes]
MQAVPEDASTGAFSYMTPMGYMPSYSCGYCRRSRTGQSLKRRSYYARSVSMSSAFYQALVDRNWRRSGSLLYRPNQRDACCPHYSLRVDSDRFRPSREQRQTINRFNRFVIGDAYTREAAYRYPKSRDQARRRDTEFNLTERVHESESRSLKQPPAPAHSFDVTLESDDFTEEKYAVFENYQRIVHQEPASEITRSGFRKFLCNSPLRQETIVTSSGHEKRLGSYHQCYRLDGQLVAIGVLDLLPDAVSAVYFLYHESIHSWSPGKLGALREISLALEGGYRWWYPGFYIHNCPKMKYKMDYSPQQILNPDGMEWIEVSKELLAKFDRHGFLEFSKTDDNETVDPQQHPTGDFMGHEGGLDNSESGGNNDNDDDDDDDDEGHVSLLNSNMPGLPPIGDVLSYNFDSMPVRLGRSIVSAVDVFQWRDEDEDIRYGVGPRGQIAQLVAAVGLDLMPQICLSIRSY